MKIYIAELDILNIDINMCWTAKRYKLNQKEFID